MRSIDVIAVTPRGRVALAMPLLLSACGGSICANGQAGGAVVQDDAPPGCEVVRSIGGIGLLECDGGRQGFVVDMVTHGRSGEVR